jgi:TatD DNase family protein
MDAPQNPLFDTHVHLDRLPGPTPVEVQMEQARQAGVGGAVVPGVERAGWPGLLAVVRRTPGAWAAPGLHPLAAGSWDADCRRELEGLLFDPVTVAVGEIGLDGVPGAPPMDQQERAFREQLQLAVTAGKPVLIHCRRASGRLLELLREERAGRVGGILHAFSGSIETARAALRLGFGIGFGGPVTYSDARRAVAVLQALPAEAIVLETDAPDLAPHPHRGQDNRPAWLPLIAARVGTLRNWSLPETARITTANARRILKLSP